MIAAGYAAWSVYHDRQTVAASAAFDTAMKAYTGRIGAADPAEAGEPSYADEGARSADAVAEIFHGGGQISEHEVRDGWRGTMRRFV